MALSWSRVWSFQGAEEGHTDAPSAQEGRHQGKETGTPVGSDLKGHG